MFIPCRLTQEVLSDLAKGSLQTGGGVWSAAKGNPRVPVRRRINEEGTQKFERTFQKLSVI